MWQLSQQHSLYLSYTDIFSPPNYKDKDNNLLTPVPGENLEPGGKSSPFDKLYWANIDYANYGKPRQLTLSVRWQY